MVVALCIALGFALMLLGDEKRKHRKSREDLEKQISEQTSALRRKEQEITDSIRYALRIQLSIIPTPDRVKALLPKSMVFYKPKDIVSGDFYWVEEINNEVVFAAVDCTGHGVPGAMMSVVGLKSLNQAVQDKKLSRPGDILQHLDIAVNDTLRQSSDANAVKDGMDLALCNINYRTLILQYAGAFNGVCIIRKNIAASHQPRSSRELFYGNDLLELRPDKLPIGSNTDGIADTFMNHEFQLRPNDLVYIYTDGYADQFGGPKGKKFKYNQLKDLLVSLADVPVESHFAVLEKSLKDWQGSQEQVDDVLVIGVRI
jgi:serine phosphatase RsbU (regulator of sigma subunit)